MEFLNWGNSGKWNFDKIQEGFIRMIGNCELTKEQVERISANLIFDNRCLNNKGFNKTSIERFDLEKDSLLMDTSKWIEETRKKVI